MTEDEAKTKWCPFARQAALLSRETGECATANRDGGNHYGVDNVNCIGAACMAWRVTREQFRDATTGALSDRNLSGNGQWVKDGYCGLAGAPQ